MKLSITVFRKKEETPIHTLGVSEIIRKASDHLKKTDTMSFSDIIDDEAETAKDYECPVHDIIHHSAEGCPMCLLEKKYKTHNLSFKDFMPDFSKEAPLNIHRGSFFNRKTCDICGEKNLMHWYISGGKIHCRICAEKAGS
jgi:hypothetical protein